MSLAHAVSVFGISDGISALQDIVLGGPCDQLVGFQQICSTHYASAGDFSNEEGCTTVKAKNARVKTVNSNNIFQWHVPLRLTLF